MTRFKAQQAVHGQHASVPTWRERAAWFGRRCADDERKKNEGEEGEFADAASLARIRPERNERRRGTQASKAGMSWACRSLWLQT
jgi:hypothetical protein